MKIFGLEKAIGQLQKMDEYQHIMKYDMPKDRDIEDRNLYITIYKLLFLFIYIYDTWEFP